MSGFDEISFFGVNFTEFFNSVGLIRFQIDDLEIGFFGFVVLFEFLVAESSHEMDLVEFGVFIDHDLQLIYGGLVLLFLDELLYSH